MSTSSCSTIGVSQRCTFGMIGALAGSLAATLPTLCHHHHYRCYSQQPRYHCMREGERSNPSWGNGAGVACAHLWTVPHTRTGEHLSWGWGRCICWKVPPFSSPLRGNTMHNDYKSIDALYRRGGKFQNTYNIHQLVLQPKPPAYNLMISRVGEAFLG